MSDNDLDRLEIEIGRNSRRIEAMEGRISALEVTDNSTMRDLAVRLTKLEDMHSFHGLTSPDLHKPYHPDEPAPGPSDQSATIKRLEGELTKERMWRAELGAKNIQAIALLDQVLAEANEYYHPATLEAISDFLYQKWYSSPPKVRG